MDKNILDRQADAKLMDRLEKDGLLNYKAACMAREALLPPCEWYTWSKRFLLLLGSALVLAGIIYFFAYNWADMGKILKFGLLQGGIIGCVIAGYIIGFGRLGGKILLLSASVLVGVLMAVFGQIYQTGADAWELFVGWAVLIFGFVVVSEFAGLWLLWMVVVNVAVITFWEQVCKPVYTLDSEYMFACLGLINGLVLMLFEYGSRRSIRWMESNLLKYSLLTGILVFLSIPVEELIFEFRLWHHHAVARVVCSGIWLACVSGCFCLYRFRIKKILPLTLIAADVITIVVSLIGRWLDKLHIGDGVTMMIIALVILALSCAAVFWLKKVFLKIADGNMEVMANE